MTQARQHDDHQELAWAAGFFDAEGSFSYTASNRSGAVHISQTENEILERFRVAVGVGSVTGPYLWKHPNRLSKRPQFFYQVYARASVHRVAERLWPWLGRTKRAKAIEVLKRVRVDHRLGLGDQTEGARFDRKALAWAAGFMDGEGCFSYSPSNQSPCVAITNTEAELLVRFRDIVGVGKIYGPYANRNGIAKKAQYFYRANGQENVQAILAMLWFKLGSAKRAQGAGVLSHRRRACHKGHPKIAGRSGCGTCQSEYWQSRREGRPYVSKYRQVRGLSENAPRYVICERVLHRTPVNPPPQLSGSRASFASPA